MLAVLLGGVQRTKMIFSGKLIIGLIPSHPLLFSCIIVFHCISCIHSSSQGAGRGGWKAGEGRYKHEFPLA